MRFVQMRICSYLVYIVLKKIPENFLNINQESKKKKAISILILITKVLKHFI